MTQSNIKVEIPLHYLLIIACHGNMGDGELPDIMKAWAIRVCEQQGYSDELSAMKAEKIKALRSSLRNVMGDEMMAKMHKSINEGLAKFGIKGGDRA